MGEVSCTADTREADGPHGQSDGRSANLAGAELTVVVPTLNERENIEPLLHRLETVLRGIAWSSREPVDRFNELATLGARVSDP